MKLRGLFIALMALGLVVGTLYLAGKRKAKTDAAEAGKTSEKLFSVQADDIQQVTLQPASGDKVTLDREGDKWKISEPAGVRADEWAASSVVTTLGSLSVDQMIADAPGALKEYGLDPPQAAVQFRTKTGAQYTLLIGESTPTGGGVYVKAENQPRVVTVSSYAKTDLTKSLFELRDKSVLKLDSGSASRIWLANKSGKIELVKNADNWELAAPASGRLDQAAVNDLIRGISDAKMQGAESTPSKDDPKVNAKLGLASPEITVKAQDASGAHELAISAEEDGKRYARSSDQPVVFVVASDLATALSKSAADLRNKDLFEMDSWTASHLDAATPEAHVVLDKPKDQWTGSDPKKVPDGVAVGDLLEKLKAIRADSFPAPAAASKFGLDQPVLKVQVTWGEKKQQETVEFGMAGSKAYARRLGDPAVCEIAADKLTDARDAVNKLK